MIESRDTASVSCSGAGTSAHVAAGGTDGYAAVAGKATGDPVMQNPSVERSKQPRFARIDCREPLPVPTVRSP